MKNNTVPIIIVLFVLAGITVWALTRPPVQVTNVTREVVTTVVSPTTPTTAKTTVSLVPTVPPKTIQLEQVKVSGQSGTATFVAEGDNTKVTLSMVGKTFASSQPAHIHMGKCPNPDAVKYPLTNVVGGKSETIVPVKINDLFNMLPLAVNVHESVEKSSIYTACGDLK